MRLTVLAAIVVLFFSFPAISKADSAGTSSLDSLRPCIGFDPERRRWGLIALSGQEPFVNCPADMAVTFHLPLLGGEQPPSAWPLVGSCCPIPAGSLVANVHFAAGECPDGTVVTGARYRTFAPGAKDVGFGFELACAEIDQRHFHLSDKHPAITLEYGRFNALDSFFDPSMAEPGDWSALPSSIRYGMGRVSKTRWVSSGCAAYPWGSVMTKMGTTGCKEFQFREILPNTPADSQAELHCRGIVNLNDPESTCVLGGE